MTSRRIEAGPLLVLAGALLLLVGLFLPWYEPRLEAWQVFELVDLLLAALGVAALLVALGMLAGLSAAPDARLLPWIGGAAFVLVAAGLLDRPPVVGDGDRDVGAWLSLAGASLMAAGTLLALARVSIAFDVERRGARRRVAGADPRRPAEPEPPHDRTTPTEPIDPVGKPPG